MNPQMMSGLVLILQFLLMIIVAMIAYWGKKSDQKQDALVARIDAAMLQWEAKFESNLSAVYARMSQYQTTEKCGLHHDSHTKEHVFESQINADAHKRIEKDTNGLGQKVNKIDERVLNLEKK